MIESKKRKRIGYSLILFVSIFVLVFAIILSMFTNITAVSATTYGTLGPSDIDTWEWNIYEGHYASTIQLGNDSTYTYFAIACTGNTGIENDGFVRTFKAWNSNGTISKAIIESLEYDTSDGYGPSICAVDSDTYAISYYDAGATKETIKTINISTVGDIAAAVTDTQVLSYQGVTTTSRSQLLKIGTGNTFVVCYTDSSTDLWLETLNITNDGMIQNTVTSTREIDTSDGLFPDIAWIDSDTLAVVYDLGAAGSNDGYLSTWNITSAGMITLTKADGWEFETTKCVNPSILKVTGNIFAIAYENNAADIYFYTTTISDTGAITKSWADTQLVDAANGDYANLFSIGDGTGTEKIVGLTYLSSSTNVLVTTNITATGLMSGILDTTTFLNSVWFADAIQFKDTNGFFWFIGHSLSGNDGGCTTVSIFNGIVEVSAFPDSEHDSYGDWDDPTNGYADDSNLVTIAGATSQDYYGFDFSSIPSGSTIVGIMPYGEFNGGEFYATQITGYVTWDDYAHTSSGITTSIAMSTSSILLYFGDQSNLWGRTWTTNDLAENMFRFKMTSNGGDAVSMDYVKVNVYYISGSGSSNTAPTQTSQCIWDNIQSINISLNATQGVAIAPYSFNVTIADINADKMNVTIKTNASGTWNTVNTSVGGSGLTNGTYKGYNTSWIDTWNKKYWISFNVTDGETWTNETKWFTTRAAPTVFIHSPANSTTPTISTCPTISIHVNTTSGFATDVYFLSNFTGNWVVYQINSSVASNGSVTWVFDEATISAHTYYWKVNRTQKNDGSPNATSWYKFKTSGTPPNIVINFAGNISELGGPYYRPPGEADILDEAGEGVWRDGYYTNNSYQKENWIYINLSVTDTESNINKVFLHWYNETAGTWLNTTEFTQKGSYYEYNKTSVPYGKYSFDVFANDTTSLSTLVYWNKTGIGGGLTRRYVHLNCTQMDVTYLPLYFYEGLRNYQGTSDSQTADRLEKDQGLDGGNNDTGFLRTTELNDAVESVQCSGFVGLWFDENTSITPFTLTNIYYHVWYSLNNSIGSEFDKIGWNNSRGLSDENFKNYYIGLFSQTRSKLYLPDAPEYSDLLIKYSKYYNLTTKLLPVTSTSFTDNNIYELEIIARETGGYPSVISNRSYTSFILLNVPSNETLNATGNGDTDYDGLSDWSELYLNYTNPFLSDTDNDGLWDTYEEKHGSDPNNYTSKSSFSNTAPVFSSESPDDESNGISLTPRCLITVTDANGDLMRLDFYENSTDEWVLRQTNSSCVNGTYTFDYTQASEYLHTYWWKVSCNDGKENTTAIYSFTTFSGNHLPVLSGYVTSTAGVDSYTVFSFKVNVSDADSENPTYVNVTIKRVGWSADNMTMAWISGSNTTIAPGHFQYTATLTTGTDYTYQFWVYDGHAYNHTTAVDNPDVSAQSYLCGITYSSGSNTTWCNFTSFGTSGSQANVPMKGQTTETPALQIQNQGNVPINLTIKINSEPGSGLTLKWDDDNDPTGATTITTSEVLIEINLAIDSTENIWMWMDYVNAAPGSGEKTITITAKPGEW